MFNLYQKTCRLFTNLLLSILVISLFGATHTPKNVSASREESLQSQTITPFLHSPYPGAVAENSLFDHHMPTYTIQGRTIVTYTGHQAVGTQNDPNCDGIPPDNNDCEKQYNSASLNFLLSYDGHPGIDYDTEYLPIFAAADSDELDFAGWWNPANHADNLGLHVRLRHPNGYTTLYGHLSAISVSTCVPFTCGSIRQGEMIGVSGNTGFSTGPHLHFEVQNSNGNRVDPYGWNPDRPDLPASDVQDDPAPVANQSGNLWVDFPEISETQTVLYRGEGNPLTYPLFPGSSNSTLIDDYGHILAENGGQLPPGSSPNFTAGSCWTVPNEDPLTSIELQYFATNFYKLLALTNAAECSATWSLPADQPSGNYAIYVHLPGTNNNPVANSVPYRIYADGEEVAKVLINQGQIESYLESELSSADYTTNAAWLYVGSYFFVQGEDNYISVSNVPEETILPGGLVLADSVKFHSVDPGSVDTVLIVDSSGSMISNDPQNKRLQASRIFVSNAAVQEDYVGVVDFDTVGRVLTNPPLQKLHDNDVSVIAAINSIPSNGSSTNIGAGLQQGCNVLQLSDRTHYRRGAILLTDGIGSLSGQDQCFKTEGWPVYTFGFGQANDAQLQQIAFNTGGGYKRVTSLTSLTCEFIRVRSLIANVEPPPCVPYNVPQLASISFSQTVAPGQAQGTFSTGWPGSDVVMTLTSPSGRVIDRNTVAPDVVHENGSTYEVYTIANPEPGNWNVSLYGANVPASGEEVIFGFASVPAPEPTSCTPSNAYASSQGAFHFASYQTTSSLTEFSQLPLSFVPNLGQEDGSVRFQVQGLGGNLFFTPSEVVFALPNPVKVKEDDKDKLRYDLHPASVVHIHYQGANENPEVIGLDELPGVVNYLKGSDPSQWRTNVPTYAGIAYRELYPGIELRYEGTDGILKSTFHVAPGADPSAIVWKYKGAESLSVDESGNLVITLPPVIEGEPGKTLVEQAPFAWQEVNGNRVMVAVQYAVNKKDKKVSFALPNGYDSTLPLVIDPTISYSAYLGGSKSEGANAITLDSDCNVYVAGYTSSTAYPTQDPYQTNLPATDAFVTKLNAAGDAILYSTYLGGNGSDDAWGIGLDSDGRITVVGETESSDFPTRNAYDGNYDAGTCSSGPCDDVFVAQLLADGSDLRYSTYLGGSGDDEAFALALGPNGIISLTGRTKSSTFPTVNAYDNSFGGGTCSSAPCEDAFVAQVDPALIGTPSLRYSTFLGRNNYDGGMGIALDSFGHVYVAGYTRSDGLASANAYQPARAGSTDAFVAKFDTTLSGSATRLYTTYLGGSQNERALGIALHGADQVYLTGYTESSTFPLQNPFDNQLGGVEAFVTHLDIANNILVYSSFLGGGNDEEGLSITVDEAGNAYITGFTESTDFPLQNAIQAQKGADSCSETPCSDAFIVKVNANGTAILFSTYIGGSWEEYGNAILVDGLGGIYVAGRTYSSNFPATTFPYVGGSGYSDAFVVKIEE